MRKVIHVDMDAFYAAVEERDDPTLRGRPIAVGGGSPRGVVMTASYAARRFGVRSAMPGARALQLCPEIVFVRPRFDAYKSVSRDIQAIFHRFTDLVEPLSLDEAYLDVTNPTDGPVPAMTIARSIKQAIFAETGLTASAGVSMNKFLAKLASEMEKPDGLCLIRPEQSLGVLARLSIDRFHGVGPATARRLRAAGIAVGGDLQALDETEAIRRLGRQGRHFWLLARGVDDRPVRPERERKSLSVETTFAADITALESLETALVQLAEELSRRLARSDFGAATVTLKIKYRDFRLTTRQTTLSSPPRDPGDLAGAASMLLRRAALTGPVRLLGLGVGGPAVKLQQLTLPLGDVAGQSAAPADNGVPPVQG